MEKLYYIPSHRMNARIADTVVEGEEISIEGITYQRLSRAPIGRSVQKRLRKTDESQRIVIYS
jgi:hypothetical protein